MPRLSCIGQSHLVVIYVVDVVTLLLAVTSIAGLSEEVG